MSRARTYPVGGLPGPIHADKPCPTKTQIVTIMEASRVPMTQPAVVIAAARLYGMQPQGQRWEAAKSWARTVIDVPALERLLAAMEIDGLVDSKEAHEWADMGYRISGAQARSRYYMTARQVLLLSERTEQHQDADLMAQAEEAADNMMRKLHKEHWERARDAAYNTLRNGARAPRRTRRGSP